MSEEKKEEIRVLTKNTGRHTWIGEEPAKETETVSLDKMVWNDESEKPHSDRNTSGNIYGATRVVEKQKRPYSGFITDEELRDSEIIRIDERKRLDDPQDLGQTRIYQGFVGTENGPEKETEEPAPVKRKRKIKARTINISDKKVVKRLIAIAAVFLILVAFEISFVAMKYSLRSLPGKTATLKAQTAELTEENKKIEEEISGYAGISQIEELKSSWESLKEKLEKSE